MNVSLKALLIAGVSAVVWAGGAMAHDNRVSVVTKDNIPAVSTNGRCVRVNQALDNDPCGAAKKMVHASSEAPLALEETLVYFDFDSVVVSPSEQRKLDRIIAAFDQGDVQNVRIVGYADPIGSPAYNEALSQRRAQAVLTYLSSKGFQVDSPVSLKGLGATDSMSRCEAVKGFKQRVECLWKDRRVEVSLDFVSEQSS